MTAYGPGAVAVATVRGEPNVRVFLTEVNRADDRYSVWRHTRVGVHHYSHPDQVTDIRPLVVLDLNHIAPNGAGNDLDALVADLRSKGWHGVAEQVRAQTKPPRIPEPGLWGVVEAGVKQHDVRLRWVRLGGGNYRPDDSNEYDRVWSDLIDPVLIREGVES